MKKVKEIEINSVYSEPRFINGSLLPRELLYKQVVFIDFDEFRKIVTCKSKEKDKEKFLRGVIEKYKKRHNLNNEKIIRLLH